MEPRARPSGHPRDRGRCRGGGATTAGGPGIRSTTSGRTSVLCSLYLGGAGMIWALSRLGSSLDCRSAVAAALERYRAAPDFGRGGARAEPAGGGDGRAHGRGPARVAGGRPGPPERAGARQSRASDLGAAVGVAGHDPRGPGLRPRGRVARERAAALRALGRILGHVDGTTSTAAGSRYLGPAHGFAGNVHALRGFVDEEILRARVARLLTRTAGRQDGLVNWPPMDGPPARLRRRSGCSGVTEPPGS